MKILKKFRKRANEQVDKLSTFAEEIKESLEQAVEMEKEGKDMNIGINEIIKEKARIKKLSEELENKIKTVKIGKHSVGLNVCEDYLRIGSLDLHNNNCVYLNLDEIPGLYNFLKQFMDD